MHKWVNVLKGQHNSQVGKRLEMSTLYPSGYKVKNVNIMHKWVKA